MYSKSLLAAVAGAALAATGASAQSMNLTAALAASPDLSNLTSYISMFPNLLSSLTNATNITILAPSNEAFAKFLKSEAAATVTGGNTDAIQAILEYHVLNGTYPASKVTESPAFLKSMLMNKSYANVTGGQVVEAVKQGNNVVFYSGLLSNSTVTKADTNFTGGVIHVIDTLLTVPVNATGTFTAAGLSAVAGAVKKAGLTDALDYGKDLTIFAPNNAAFEAIGSVAGNISMEALAMITEYHVINGSMPLYSSMLMNDSMLMSMGGKNVTVRMLNGSVFVNSAKVVLPNVLIAEGVVHVIDNVLNPGNATASPNPSMATQAPAFPGVSSASNIGVLTSGIATPTTVITTGGPTGAAATGGSGSGGAKSSSTSGGAMPMRTGAIGAAALFAGAGVLINGY